MLKPMRKGARRAEQRGGVAGRAREAAGSLQPGSAAQPGRTKRQW